MMLSQQMSGHQIERAGWFLQIGGNLTGKTPGKKDTVAIMLLAKVRFDHCQRQQPDADNGQQRRQQIVQQEKALQIKLH
jgi:hypothetical protein